MLSSSLPLAQCCTHTQPVTTQQRIFISGRVERNDHPQSNVHSLTACSSWQTSTLDTRVYKETDQLSAKGNNIRNRADLCGSWWGHVHPNHRKTCALKKYASGKGKYSQWWEWREYSSYLDVIGAPMLLGVMTALTHMPPSIETLASLTLWNSSSIGVVLSKMSSGSQWRRLENKYSQSLSFLLHWSQ